MSPDAALKKIRRELTADLPSGFVLNGHQWVRVLDSGICHTIDLRPMSSLRGLGVKWLRLHASVGLVTDPPKDSGRSVVTVAEHGLLRGRDVVWTLPRECDESDVSAATAGIRTRLPDVVEYLDEFMDADSFLARSRRLSDLIWFERLPEIRQWMRQPCPEIEPVRDAPTGYYQLAFADDVLDAFAATSSPLDERWKAHIEAALESVRGLTWPSVVPMRERVSERIAAAMNGGPVARDPNPRPELRLRR